MRSQTSPLSATIGRALTRRSDRNILITHCGSQCARTVYLLREVALRARQRHLITNESAAFAKALCDVCRQAMEGRHWKTLVQAHAALNEGAAEIALRLFCRLLRHTNVSSQIYVFEGYLGRARTLLLLARYDEAAQDLDVCLKRWPDSSSIAGR